MPTIGCLFGVAAGKETIEHFKGILKIGQQAFLFIFVLFKCKFTEKM